MKTLAADLRGSKFTFALSWLAMTAVVTVLNALPSRHRDDVRPRPTPPSNFRH